MPEQIKIQTFNWGFVTKFKIKPEYAKQLDPTGQV